MPDVELARSQLRPQPGLPRLAPAAGQERGALARARISRAGSGDTGREDQEDSVRLHAEDQEPLSQDSESDRLAGLIQCAKSGTCLSILVGHFISCGKSVCHWYYS